MARKHGFFRPHLGVGFPQVASTTLSEGAGGGIAIPYSADWVNEAYTINDETVTAAEAYSLTRATGGRAVDSGGAWTLFDVDEPRITDLGLVIEATTTNVIRSPDMDSVSPNPDNWYPLHWAAPFAFNGISAIIAATGTEHGLPYIDLTFSGTPTGTGGVLFFFEQGDYVVTETGDSWLISLFAKVQSGSLSGVDVIRQRLYEHLSDGNAATAAPDHYGADLVPALTSSLVRFAENPFVVGAADAVRAQHGLEVLFTGAANLTLRLAWPQMELDKLLPSTPIKGALAADVVTLKLPSGATHDLRNTFDDDTTQTFADVAGGDYVIDPADLDLPQSKSVVWRG